MSIQLRIIIKKNICKNKIIANLLEMNDNNIKD